MNPVLHDKLGAALGSLPSGVSKVSGGDINDVFEVVLEDGRALIVKTNTKALPGMYAHEAAGLEQLARARALRVPDVLARAEADAQGPAFLAMERIASARRAHTFDEALGRGLAALHRHSAPAFGASHDNYIALLPQRNGTHARWADFYAQERLLPQLELAQKRGRAPSGLSKAVERVCERLPELVPRNEPPALLHGDLWSGNLIVDEHGAPCLIDPAVYFGAREIDLAMMRLFGGFSERTFAAYHEAFALRAGHEARVALYQLYPLLVHVNLFGGSYAAQAQRLAERYA